ncbi:MAG: secretin and TonB N-terminal domain-containing protein [Geminocystis sp.]|nr:secretin and TonB N-terminal domain-containing protein [Geminocystis sp.]
MGKVYRPLGLVSGSVALLFLWPMGATANVKLDAKPGEGKPTPWIAQSPPRESNSQNQEVLFPNPTILIDGKPVNGTAPQPAAPPPFLPRAVAPPVGDMAVSNVNALPPRVDLGTNARVPRLVLRSAPAPEVLALLARAAGLNVIFTEGEKEAATKTITLELDNEPIQDIFNNVLLMSGLNASRQGNTIFIGKTLPPSVKNSITRTIRLNQYNVIGAANFLNSQGAQGYIVEAQEATGGGKPTFSLRALPTTQERENEYLILRALSVHADPINNSITLVGEPHLVQTATSFLTQLDVRRRQVAVNVKVVDVQLGQQDSFGSSFSFGIDNTGVIQDGGVGVINFGTNSGNVDPQQWRVSGPGGGLQPAFQETITITENFGRDLTEAITRDVQNLLNQTNNQEVARNLTDTLSRNLNDTINRTLNQFGSTTNFSRSQVETLTRALQEALTQTTVETLERSLNQSDLNNLTQTLTDSVNRTVTRTLQGQPLGFPNPGRITPFGTTFDPNNPRGMATVTPGLNFNVPQAFLAQIRASIQSGNAKILTDPTIVIQDGQKADVELGEEVIVGVRSERVTDEATGTTYVIVNPEKGIAGLKLSVRVEKIDDNGFITLEVNPDISVPAREIRFDSGQALNTITLLQTRRLSSGRIRMRDGQTLILTGIIQDSERTTVSKIPILGDLPIIGSLFRASTKQKTRSEVVVIITPRILDDSEPHSGIGYNYTPSRETGRFLRDRGINLPTSP